MSSNVHTEDVTSRSDGPRDFIKRSDPEDNAKDLRYDAGRKERTHPDCVKARRPSTRAYSAQRRNKACLAVLSVAVGIVCVWLQSNLQRSLASTSGVLNTSSVITIQTRFTPLDPEAFSSFIDSKESRSSLAGILKWKTPSVSWTWIRCQRFASLLPPDGIKSTIGYVWRLLPDDNSQDVMYSSKYVAPPPSGPVEELLHDLLSLFHPQPFLYSRYGPRGSVAVVRAKNHDCLDVWFRLHAEYQLNTPPQRPLWFTPASFVGRLIVNATDLGVKHFSLGVPKDKPLNVDLEWLIGPDEDKDMEVTITYLPEMSLAMEGASTDEIWSEEITSGKAMALMGKEFYRFKKVEYHNFSKVYLEASEKSKPVHTIALWGVLDDQSC